MEQHRSEFSSAGAEGFRWTEEELADFRRAEAEDIASGVADTPEYRAWAYGAAAFAPVTTPEPFARTLSAFIALKSGAPAALLGDEAETLLPVAGFGMLGAKGGKGKTTLTADAVFHLASGVEWLGFKVPRPVRILVIENEGPRELFRRKLEAKLAAWPHEIPPDAIHIYDADWAAFTLTSEAGRLRSYIAEHRIELVVGDPLDSLGMRGVGSPEDTREFVKLLTAAGLGRDVAFWLPHHCRKDQAEDELDEISGAWGGRIDTLLMLAKLDGNRARLSFPKVRWSRRGERAALILAFEPETEGYIVAHEEPPEERDLVAEVEKLLADREPRTAREIAAPREGEQPGIGANRNAVVRVLESHPDTFVSGNGKDFGRSARSIVWLLARPAEPAEPVGGSGGTERATGLLARPYLGASRPEPVPTQDGRNRPGSVSQSANGSDPGADQEPPRTVANLADDELLAFFPGSTLEHVKGDPEFERITAKFGPPGRNDRGG